jgi:hypothetical protein
MADFHVYWNEKKGHIRIHRSECVFCNHGQGLYGGGRTDKDGWEPAKTYQKAREIIEKLQKDKATLYKNVDDCGKCHPR